jgi:hypothetical protein
VCCFSSLAPCEPSYTRPVSGELERSLRPGGERQIAFPDMRARPAASQKDPNDAVVPARFSSGFAYGCREGRRDDSEYVELASTISAMTSSQSCRSLVSIDLSNAHQPSAIHVEERVRRLRRRGLRPGPCAQSRQNARGFLTTDNNGRLYGVPRHERHARQGGSRGFGAAPWAMLATRLLPQAASAAAHLRWAAPASMIASSTSRS